MPKFEIADPTFVVVDGRPSGSVPDVVLKFAGDPSVSGDMIAALRAWYEAPSAALADAEARWTRSRSDAEAARAESDDRFAAQEARHAAELEAARSAHAAALAEMRGQFDAAQAGVIAASAAAAEEAAALVQQLRGEIAKKDELIAAMGGTELAQELARQAQRKELLEAKAKIEAELAAVDGTEGTP